MTMNGIQNVGSQEGRSSLGTARALPRLTAGSTFLAAYLAFFFISKLLGFSSGYAPDDYVILRQGDDAQLLKFFLSQGRYSTALVEAALQACGLTMSAFSTIGLVATGLFSGLFYRDAIRFQERSNVIQTIGVGALLGAHSYYTEYVSFRQAALPMSLVFLGLWLSLRLYLKALPGPHNFPAILGSLILATFVMGINQLAVSFVAIAVISVHTRRLLDSDMAHVRSSVPSWFYPPLYAALAGFVVIICNLVAAKLVMVFADVSGNQRAALLPMELWQQRAGELAMLLPKLWFKSETVASWPAKVLAIAAFVMLLASSHRKTGGNASLALSTFAAATAAALVPTAASAEWWPVPRTLIAVPFALAVAIAILNPRRGVMQSFATGLLIASACLFSAHSQAILFNQQRLNRWDQMQARDISQLAIQRFPASAAKIAIVEPEWSHEIAQDITQGDLNVSAFSVEWAVDPLFDEATGRDHSVRVAPELQDLCRSSHKYPDPSVIHEQNGEVVVCMH